jgi:hypothetical protein
MKILCAGCLLAGFWITTAGAAEPAPNIAGETIEQTATRTGYTVEQLRKFFPAVKLDFDEQGLAKQRFRAPPAPGVHPRVFFNAEDLPDIRRRARETAAGRILVARLREECDLALRADPQEARSKKVTSVRDLYDQLSEGRLAAPLKPQDPLGKRLGNLIPLEAFRTLLDEDEAGARHCAAALAGFLRLYDAEDRARIRQEPDFQPIISFVFFGNFGMAYDCLHPAMTEGQRREVREFLTLMTCGKTSTGMKSVPAFPANTTNWIPFHASLLSNVLAIEGEEGFDPLVYQGMVETMRKWLAFGAFPSGALWESMGKNEMGAEYLIPLAKRGELLIASRPARNHVANFYLQVMQPYGREWTWFTDHGGSHGKASFIDVEVVKYAFPGDPAIDFVYRNMTGEDYAYCREMPWRVDNVGPLNGVAHILRVVMAEDHAAGSWAEGLRAATSGKSLAFFDDGLGCLVARSAWGPDALQLIFQPRHVPDGHSQAERGMFTFSALGRNWAEKVANSGGSFTGSSAESRFQSVVLIDDVGQGVNHTPSGKSLALADTADASFLAIDARDAYCWKLGGTQLWDRTPNDHRLTPSPLPWMSLPWRDLPHWLYGGKCETVAPKEPLNRFESVTEWNPVQRAFRTAGVVRGPHPYAIIVDDIQKDAAEHGYKWLMQLADDLELVESLYVDFTADQRLEWYKGNTSGFRADLILAGRDEAADPRGRRLLVRVLQNSPSQTPHVALTLPGFIEIYQKDIRGHRALGIGRRLVIPSRSVAPDFKVLLYPHRQGEPLPTTTWNKDKTRLTIDWPDQEDGFVFRKGGDGRTRFVIDRKGRNLAEIK